jgi:hypothetical protein
MLLALIGLGGIGYFIVKASSQSMQYPMAEQKEAGDKMPSSTGYMELSHVAWDPALSRFASQEMWPESEETGPFGVPRRFFTDASGWVVPTFGYNFDKM